MASSRPHIVIFPFMAHGHTIPLIDLSKALSRRGLKVTIITTPSNASSIKPHISKSPNVHIKTIPFPKDVQGLPIGCENMSGARSPCQALAFLNATKLLEKPFEAAMREMMMVTNDAPRCVVSDSFLGWTNGLCRGLGVPRLVFNGMGVFATLVKKSLAMHKGHESALHDGDKVDVKGIDLSFDLTRGDLPLSLRASDSGMAKFFLEAEMSDLGSWAVIANTFVELENGYVSHLEDLYGNNGTRAFCVGPLFLYDVMEGDGGVGPNALSGPSPCEEWAQWLSRRSGEGREKYVIYVSFGSLASLCDDQLDELAYGLEQSREDYIWVVRSDRWRNPMVGVGGQGKGLIVREWVDQKRILGHRAIGGFLSHCGWNSTLESLANGVPVLAWPMQAEQHLNAKYLVEELKVGITLEGLARDGKVVGRDEICEGVKELMSGVRGKKARGKAIEFEKVSKRAVQVGGSSYNCLNEIIERMFK